MTSNNKRNKKKRVVLLDSHAILHRAYHALPDFQTDGKPTGALYGLSLMLLKIITELNPDYIIAAYDLPEPTYRHEVYADYKSGRKEADEELISQIERSREIFEAFNIPIYEAPGFEADDVLGTLSENLKKDKSVETIIASGDMDTLQLVRGQDVRVYTLRKGIKDTVIYDEKAVKERFGFGPILLPDYKGLRGDPSDNIPGIKGIGEKTATILLTKIGSLEKIYKELKKNKDKFQKIGLTPRMVNLLEEGEEEAFFSKELGEIRKDAPIEHKLETKTWRETFDAKPVLELFRVLSFRSLGTRLQAVFGLEEERPDIEISEREITKVGVALWLLDSDITTPRLDEILNYAKTESFQKAKRKILDDLKKFNLEDLYQKTELPLIEVVESMNKRGIKTDVSFLKKLSKEYHQELLKLKKKIWKLAGKEFNINSPKQLSEILFDDLSLGTGGIKKTAGGQRSTREKELLKLKDKSPIVEEILKHRELQKLLSTYIDNLPQMVEKDGRLHADFKQTGTTTGRMSSQNPNMQNIPIRTKLGREIRKAFVAEKGYKLLSFDYSQMELKIAAFLSKDQKLIEMFKGGEDIHLAVASEVFDVLPEKVTKKMRIHAKTINFGILYGMGVNALREALGTDRKTAQDFYNDYFEKFEGITNYLEETKRFARRNGYTETYFGRRRHFPGIVSKLPHLRAQAERMAINAPIQGTQADVIRMAMVKLHQNMREKAPILLQVHDELVFEIKEKDIPNTAKEIKNIMENIIPKKEVYGVELSVQGYVGDNWGQMKEIL